MTRKEYRRLRDAIRRSYDSDRPLARRALLNLRRLYLPRESYRLAFERVFGVNHDSYRRDIKSVA